MPPFPGTRLPRYDFQWCPGYPVLFCRLATSLQKRPFQTVLLSLSLKFISLLEEEQLRRRLTTHSDQVLVFPKKDTENYFAYELTPKKQRNSSGPTRWRRPMQLMQSWDMIFMVLLCFVLDRNMLKMITDHMNSSKAYELLLGSP